MRKLQLAAAQAIANVATPAQGDDRQRALARIGAPNVVEDLLAIGSVLQSREALETFNGKLPGYLRMFGDSQIAATVASLNVPSLQTPQVLPFALSLVMQRLTAPWQIIRLAVKMAASDDEIRVAATPYGVAVSIALHDLYFVAACLRTDIRRGHFEEIAEQLKTLHDGVRGLRTELDLRNEFHLGQAARLDPRRHLQLAAVGNRKRARPRPPCPAPARRQGHPAGAKVDMSEVEEIAGLIDFVAVCRTYASELAINEVTLRTYSDLQHYVEQSTEALVQSLRNEKGRLYRQQQMKAAIRFCEVLFGTDYAVADEPGGGERNGRRPQACQDRSEVTTVQYNF